VKRLGILLSGRGSNFEAIAKNIENGRLGAEIALVISNYAEARGIEIAREHGLPAMVLPSKGVPRQEYDRRLVAELQNNGVELVCLAGFMRLLTSEFCRAFPLRALNIHPSLLPAFPGLDAQRQALEHGAKISGCTVHFVDEQLDAGPIILQAGVPVLDDDTEQTLAARILAEEHRIYSDAIGIILAGRWRMDGRRVICGPSDRGMKK
jgi:phosphoribosylglycinamide formyltransferase-1